MSSGGSREANRGRVLDWTCPTCNSRMSLKDQQAHLNGSRHAERLLDTAKKGSTLEPSNISPASAIDTRTFKEFVAEQKKIYKAKKGRMIAAAIEERRAIVAAEAVPVAPLVPTVDIPRFAPGARFPSRSPTDAELPVVFRVDKPKKKLGDPESPVVAKKDRSRKPPKETESPTAVKKERVKKVPKDTGSPAVTKDETKTPKEAGSPVVAKNGRAKKAPQEARSPQSPVMAKKDRPKKAPGTIELPQKPESPGSPTVVKKDRAKKPPKETESPATVKSNRAGEAPKEIESPESFASVMKERLKKTPKNTELPEQPESPESPTVAKRRRQRKASKGDSHPSPQPLPSTVETSPSVSEAPNTVQEPAIAESKSWCLACSIEMPTNEYEAHLNSWYHLAITAAVSQLQIISQLEEKTESEPASFASPESSEFPTYMDQSGSFEIQNFDEWPYIDDVSATSQETFSSITDDIWTILFRESHQAGIKHLENLKRVKRPSRCPTPSGLSRIYNRRQLTRKPQMHPDGNRRIRISQIPGVYNTQTELPTQSWLDAFIALPHGADTLVTPEEYELAWDAFNSSALVYNIDTQWGTVPLDEMYMDSTWYGLGPYDLQ